MARTINFEGRRITVPEDATDAEVASILRGQAPAPAQPKGYEDLSQANAFTRGAMGFTRPIVETVYGARQLLGGELTPDQQRVLATVRQPLGAAGGVGRVAGEVATFAVPGGAVGKGASMVTRAPNLARLGGDLAVTAGMEALKAPTDERSRKQAALEGAAGAGIGHGVGAVLRPLAQGVRNVSAEARQFMTQHPDVIPTLGQMKGGVVRGLEERAKALPFIGEQIKRRERAAVEQWNRDLAKRSLPPGARDLPAGTKTGQEAIAAVQDAYTTAYDDIFKGKRFDFSGDGNAASRIAALDTRHLPTDAADRAAKRLEDINLNFEAGPVSGTYVSRVDDSLRGWARSARQNGFSDEAEVYDEARKAFRAGLPAEANTRLAEVDAAYRQWLPVETASGYKGAATNEGVFTPSQLLGASRARSDTVRKRGFSAGNAPQQQEAQLAGRVLGNELPAPGPGTAEKILGTAAVLNPATGWPVIPASIPYSKAGAKALAGKYPWQGRMRSLSEILGKGGVTTRTIGAAVEE